MFGAGGSFGFSSGGMPIVVGLGKLIREGASSFGSSGFSFGGGVGGTSLLTPLQTFTGSSSGSIFGGSSSGFSFGGASSSFGGTNYVCSLFMFRFNFGRINRGQQHRICLWWHQFHGPILGRHVRGFWWNNLLCGHIDLRQNH